MDEMMKAYREVFSSPQGREVLTDILNDCGWFGDVWVNEYDQAKRNVAQRLLLKTGLINRDDLFDTVDKLFGV